MIGKIERIKCKPFLKWAGGKSQLKDELIARLPPSFDRYFEPFIGGGALLFALQPPRAYISDINFELINTYRCLRDNVGDLIEDLKQHIHSKEYFLYLRNLDREEDYLQLNNLKKASRFIYLNKTSYNGLYRVNSRGYYNVPFGNYKNPKILDPDNLRACSEFLQSCQIELNSFIEIEGLITKNDFVYFDPPYVPLNSTSSFTAYTRDGFDYRMQVELKELCDRLTEKNIKFMLSNSAAPSILELYKNYNVELIYASRTINSKGEKRGKIPEVIVKNY